MTDTPMGAGVEQPPLDGAAVLRRKDSPDVEWVDVEGEIVVWNAEGESLHLLDPIASIIFQLCDAVTPLAITIREMAEAFGREEGEVSKDVHQCAVTLLEAKLVERVE